MVGLYLLVHFTKVGLAMRAVSEDKETAALMGVNVNRTISTTFFIGSALAGIAGVMVGFFYLQIRVDMGFVPGIKAFTCGCPGRHWQYPRGNDWRVCPGTCGNAQRPGPAGCLQRCHRFCRSDPDIDLHAQWVVGTSKIQEETYRERIMTIFQNFPQFSPECAG